MKYTQFLKTIEETMRLKNAPSPNSKERSEDETKQAMSVERLVSKGDCQTVFS